MNLADDPLGVDDDHVFLDAVIRADIQRDLVIPIRNVPSDHRCGDDVEIAEALIHIQQLLQLPLLPLRVFIQRLVVFGHAQLFFEIVVFLLHLPQVGEVAGKIFDGCQRIIDQPIFQIAEHTVSDITDARLPHALKQQSQRQKKADQTHQNFLCSRKS